jgi:hypothetical protein
MFSVNDQRRKKPSYAIPFFFEVLELVMIWIVLGIAEASLDITQWHTVTYVLGLTWLIYTLYKLNKVLIRQTQHKW